MIHVTGGPCRNKTYPEVKPEIIILDDEYVDTKASQNVNINLVRTICICCLTQTGPLLTLDTCNYLEFLFTISEAVIDFGDKFICNLCHDTLKKFSLFRQQVQENIQTVLKGGLIKRVNKKILNLRQTPTKHTTIEDVEQNVEDFLKSNRPINENVIDVDIDEMPVKYASDDDDIEEVPVNYAPDDGDVDKVSLKYDPDLEIDIEVMELAPEAPTVTDKSVLPKQNSELVNKVQSKGLSLLWDFEPVLEPDITKNLTFLNTSSNKNESDVIKEKRQKERERIEEELRREALNAVEEHTIMTPAERQHLVWKKSVMLVLRRLCAHKHASKFLRPIRDEEAPGYSLVVKRPMDLTTIRRNIDIGLIRTTAEFERDVMQMISNALMYNPTDHSVYRMAKDLQEEADNQLRMLEEAEEHAAYLETLHPSYKRPYPISGLIPLKCPLARTHSAPTPSTPRYAKRLHLQNH